MMQKKTKRPYKKPEVSRVKLMPEQAVLSGCKTGGTTGKPEAPGRCEGACGSNLDS